MFTKKYQIIYYKHNKRTKTEDEEMKKRKLGTPDIMFNIFNYTFLGFFTLICFLPFYYLFINTISDNDLVARGLIIWRPKGIHFDNYINILKINGLGSAAVVTLARTVIGTICSTIGTSSLGYALTRKELWMRKLWYRFVIITMYFNAGVIPWFITMKNLHLTNNFLAYILPGIISPFSLVLFKTYCESIPDSMEESAQLDGAGYMTRYTRIIMPLCKPILATLVIFSAVENWNAFTDTLFLMTDRKLYTLQFVLYLYLKGANGRANSLMSMVLVIPILCVYPLFQKYFVSGIMIGAVKG